MKKINLVSGAFKKDFSNFHKQKLGGSSNGLQPVTPNTYGEFYIGDPMEEVTPTGLDQFLYVIQDVSNLTTDITKTNEPQVESLAVYGMRDALELMKGNAVKFTITHTVNMAEIGNDKETWQQRLSELEHYTSDPTVSKISVFTRGLDINGEVRLDTQTYSPQCNMKLTGGSTVHGAAGATGTITIEITPELEFVNIPTEVPEVSPQSGSASASGPIKVEDVKIKAVALK
jgi:hypothetical protein